MKTFTEMVIETTETRLFDEWIASKGEEDRTKVLQKAANMVVEDLRAANVKRANELINNLLT